MAVLSMEQQLLLLQRRRHNDILHYESKTQRETVVAAIRLR
jgi:hypothetical protein